MFHYDSEAVNCQMRNCVRDGLGNQIHLLAIKVESAVTNIIIRYLHVPVPCAKFGISFTHKYMIPPVGA